MPVVEHRGLAIRSGDRLKEGTKEGFILLDTDLLTTMRDRGWYVLVCMRGSGKMELECAQESFFFWIIFYVLKLNNWKLV